jgi:transcriptional regulator with XRE-family HTH domain
MASLPTQSRATVSLEEKKFFRDLGARVAQLRKGQGLTQSQLAEALGTTQQQIASYEVARLRVPVSLLPRLTRVLGVSLEALVGEAERPATRRGPTPKLQRHMERIGQLPKRQQRFVIQILDSVLAQAGRQGAST